jgi:hypothetical protein
MKNLLGLCLALAVIAGIAPFAKGFGTPSAPPGVAASDWVPLGDSAGFVITGDSPLPNTPKGQPGIVKGYFMIRHAASWLRVDSVPDYNVQKAALTR